MLVTAHGPWIGYDRTVKIGKPALAENAILERAAEKPGYARRAYLARRFVPAKLTQPGARLSGGGD